jgi:ATP-dependent DNA ligase
VERDRTNFTLLQRRVTAGGHVVRMAREHPAHYVVFDLLRDADGRELLDVPLAERRRSWPCARRPPTSIGPGSG